MNRRAQRRAVREQLRQAGSRARAQVSAMPPVQRARRRRRLRRAFWVAVLLLLLLLIRCDCGAPSMMAAPDAGVDAGVVAAVTPKPTKRAAVAAQRLASHQRRDWETGTQPGPSWLGAFRTQVAARSPRLATCFQGADRPGAIRWGVAVDPASGAVSDHQFEPMALGELSNAQRECLAKVLSEPKYRIEREAQTNLPLQVTLTLEF